MSNIRSCRRVIIVLVLFSIVAILSSCARLQNRDFSVPGLYSVSPESDLIRLAKETYYSLPGIAGPLESSPKPEEVKTDWHKYSGGEASRFCILLTDPRSSWLGLAHGFKSMGIPFSITDSVDDALLHRVLLVYPDLDRKADKETLLKLESHVMQGGTLLAVITRPALPLLEGLFGFTDILRNRKRTEMTYSQSEYSSDFAYSQDTSIRINNPESNRDRMSTLSFRNPREVLGTYDDGTASIIRNRVGEGTAIAFGWDLGRFIKRAQNNRDNEANRTYVNHYEPSIDTILRFLMEIYRENEPNAVTIHPAPDGQPLSVIITHDVDYAGSLSNSLEYAQYERNSGYGATYFLQTKYFTDFFDKLFFDENTPALLSGLEDLKMELASHSVSHSDMFARLPPGTYGEAYPRYQPRIIEFYFTRNASIMGELRVSKFLIESLSKSEVVSFRPGFLANPLSLPQSLESAGYAYSSATTSNDVMTNLPFRQTFDRMYSGETNIFEFPIAVEDEEDPPMDARVGKALELAEKISRYGGIFVVLIHPNVTADKLRFLQLLTEGLRDKGWWGTLKDFGDWWVARDALEADVLLKDGELRLRITAAMPVAGLTLRLPSGYEAVSPDETMKIKTQGPFTIIDIPSGISEFYLKTQAEQQRDQALQP